MMRDTLTWLLCMTCHDSIHAGCIRTHTHNQTCSHDQNLKAFTLADDGSRTQAGTRTRKHKHRRYCVDSGASVHCINDASMFDHVYENHPEVKVTVANKQVLTAKAVGTVKVTLTNQHNHTHTVTLHNVVYHPNFSENLLSVRRLWKDSRISTTFEDSNYFKDKSTGDKYRFQPTRSGYELYAFAAVQTPEDP